MARIERSLEQCAVMLRPRPLTVRGNAARRRRRLLDAGRGCDLRRGAPPGFAFRRRGGAGWHRTSRVAGKILSLEPK